MCTLTDLDNNDIVILIRENIALFNLFDGVYLFASVLDGTKIPNDVDVLLIYSVHSDVIIEETKRISHSLESLLEIPVDLTVLSIAEEIETQFLNRISLQCLRLK